IRDCFVALLLLCSLSTQVVSQVRRVLLDRLVGSLLLFGSVTAYERIRESAVPGPPAREFRSHLFFTGLRENAAVGIDDLYPISDDRVGLPLHRRRQNPSDYQNGWGEENPVEQCTSTWPFHSFHNDRTAHEHLIGGKRGRPGIDARLGGNPRRAQRRSYYF